MVTLMLTATERAFSLKDALGTIIENSGPHCKVGRQVAGQLAHTTRRTVGLVKGSLSRNGSDPFPHKVRRWMRLWMLQDVVCFFMNFGAGADHHIGSPIVCAMVERYGVLMDSFCLSQIRPQRHRFRGNNQPRERKQRELCLSTDRALNYYLAGNMVMMRC